MPRTARKVLPEAIYHVMVRSLSEILLFRDDEDKDIYLNFIKVAEERFYFTIYAFCLMNNHAHFILDPLGGNLSKILHYINTRYAAYYNKKYGRRGPVFQDRFKSEIIDSDKYLFNATVYIHANPKDIIEYKGHVDHYKYSSLIDYKERKDRFKIIDRRYLSKVFGLNIKDNLNNYIGLCCAQENIDEVACTAIEFKGEKYEYRSERRVILRDKTPKEIVNTVAGYLNLEVEAIYTKRRKRSVELRAICAYLMISFCDIPQRLVALILGNITQSGVSQLVSKGIRTIPLYQGILDYIFE